MQFCVKKQIDSVQPSVNDVLHFLTVLYDKKLQYSAINTARSALSTFIFINNVPVGQLPLVCRFMKGVFNERPALPRYKSTWDVNKVLNYLRSLSPVKDITLKLLTKKLVMLFALLSAQRAQTLHLLDVRCMDITFSKVKFCIKDLVKQTRPGKHLQDIVIVAYAPDRRLCLVTVLKEYLSRTLTLRGSETKLFISCIAPHRRVTRETISRWISSVMLASGVDTKMYMPHSTRAASVSGALSAKVPVDSILNAAGWTQDSTFRKYYRKPVSNEGLFSKAILDANKKV